MSTEPMRRVAVVGSSGSGKTTFARRLAAKLDVPHIELDGLYWLADWQPVDVETFARRVSEAIAGDRWVTDGNYGVIRPIVFERVEVVVWLDLTLWTCLSRVIRRTIRRSRTGDELWSGTGNRESWRAAFGRKSLVWWLITTHRRRRREYAALFEDPRNAHIRLHRFTSSAVADAWLERLPASG